RRDRLGGRRAGQLRSPLRALGDRALPRHLSEDEAEPVVGRRVQPAVGPARSRRPRPDRVRASDVRRCGPDGPVPRGGGAERSAAATSGSAPREDRRRPPYPPLTVTGRARSVPPLVGPALRALVACQAPGGPPGAWRRSTGTVAACRDLPGVRPWGTPGPRRSRS